MAKKRKKKEVMKEATDVCPKCRKPNPGVYHLCPGWCKVCGVMTLRRASDGESVCSDHGFIYRMRMENVPYTWMCRLQFHKKRVVKGKTICGTCLDDWKNGRS